MINSGGALTNAVLYPYPCAVHGIHVYHASGSTGIIQIHDSATVPAEGAVPLMVHHVTANSDADIEPHTPLFFKNGLYVCESDTIATKTLTTPTDLFIHVLIEEWVHENRAV